MFTIAFPSFVYTFTTLQWYQQPDSFSAFISSVSSIVD